MTVTNNLALAREQIVFVVEEETKGVLKEPEASNMVRVTNAPTFKQAPEYFDDEQFRDTRSKQTRIRGRFAAGEWNLETYIKPSGVGGTAPESDVLLKAALGDKRERAADAAVVQGAAVAVVTNGSNSTTKAYFADAASFSVGDRVKIVQTSPAATTYKTVATVDTGADFITWVGALSEAVDDETMIQKANNTTTGCEVADVSDYTVGDSLRIAAQTVTVTAKNAVTGCIEFTPALLVAMADSAPIGGGVHYFPADDPPSLSIWHYVGHTMFVISGASANKLAIDINAKDISKFTFSGQFMKMVHTGTDELAVALGANAEDTTATPSDITKFSVGSVFQCEDEVMKVTAVGASTMTVERGYKTTSRVGHDQYKPLTPWFPSGSADVGSPVHGRMGFFRVDGADVTVISGKVELDNGIKYYEEEKTGTDFAEDFDAVKLRDVKSTVELFLRTNDIKYFKYATEQTRSAVELPAGDEDGLICVVRLPKCEWSQPDLSADTEIKATIEMAALASASGNDEIVVSMI